MEIKFYIVPVWGNEKNYSKKVNFSTVFSEVKIDGDIITLMNYGLSLKVLDIRDIISDYDYTDYAEETVVNKIVDFLASKKL